MPYVIISFNPYIIISIRMSTSNSRTIHPSSIMNSTFNWQQGNMKDLLQSIDFYITPNNDFSEPFCHYTHKNLKWKEAPFLPQSFQISLGKLTCVKYLKIKSFTHGSQMTVSIAMNEAGPFEEVYKDKFICKGKTLKGEEKNIDLGALPCRAILVSVTKGCKLSSQNISVVGTDVNRIEEKLGEEYFKLLVINPMKIIYP